MRPVTAIQTGFRKSLTFSGRASRSAYWWFLPFGFGLPICVYLGLEVWNTEQSMWTHIAVSSLFLLPLISVTARRLQDTGEDGHFIRIPTGALIGFILSAWSISEFSSWLEMVFSTIDGPAGFGLLLIAGPIVLILLSFTLYFLISGLVTGSPMFGQMLVPSQSGPNKFGPNPSEVPS